MIFFLKERFLNAPLIAIIKDKTIKESLDRDLGGVGVKTLENIEFLAKTIRSTSRKKELVGEKGCSVVEI
jgi:hypothetical protein